MAKTKDVRPYVERAIKDEEFRGNIRDAVLAAREVYQELIGKRGVTGMAQRVADDKDIQENLRNAVQDLRKAADRIQGADSHKGRNTMLLLTGITLGILFNPMTGEDTRKWLKDRVFGEEDEFGYQGNSNN
ncbi:MAG: hypothetical protein M3R70_11800 [Actinomycetota bacterium]|nr:hypothetical protein [Actinomycetota bacterium]